MWKSTRGTKHFTNEKKDDISHIEDALSRTSLDSASDDSNVNLESSRKFMEPSRQVMDIPASVSDIPANEDISVQSQTAWSCGSDDISVSEENNGQLQLQPKAFQIKALELAKQGNLILNACTGSGKTLVAVLLIKHYLENIPTKTVLFIVPTVVLVQQQAQYCRDHCNDCNENSPFSQYKVAELFGVKMNDWSELDWKSCMKEHNILVGTAEVFRCAIVDKAVLQINQCSLIVFDECHHALGNSPMANIMRAVHKVEDLESPRILGLTASFITGSLVNAKDAKEKRKDLENLLQSRIFLPDFEEDEKRKPSFEMVLVEAEDFTTELLEDANMKVKSLLENFSKHMEVKVKDESKIVRDCEHVYKALGIKAFLYYLKFVVVKQLLAKIEAMKESLSNEERQKRQNKPWEDLPGKLQQEANGVPIFNENEVDKERVYSKRFKKLLEILSRKQDPSVQFKCIIFVEQVALSDPLSHILNDELGQENFSRFVVSHQHMGSQTNFKRNIAEFKDGKISVLVATAVLEEGIDVPECSVVIRFDKFNTTKSHIQGSGRARHKNAKVFYFGNVPNNEKEKASLMQEVARNEDFATTKEEKEEYGSLDYSTSFHPLRGAGGGENKAEINLSNCLTKYFEFCQQVLGQTIPQDKLIKTEVVRESFEEPPRKTVTDALYPSWKGWRQVTPEMVEEVWRGQKLKSLLPTEVYRKWKAFDIAKRRYIYAVCVYIHEENLLNGRMEANDRAKALREDFPTIERENSVKVARVSKEPSREPVDVAQGEELRQKNNTKKDFKSLLNLFCQQHKYQSPVYTTKHQKDGLFRSEVEVGPDNCGYMGEPQKRKKLAEQSGAEKALIGLEEHHKYYR